MGTQYANKNWRIFIRNSLTQKEEEISRSVTPEELKFLIAKCLDRSYLAKSLKEIKLEFKSLIKQYKYERNKTV